MPANFLTVLARKMIILMVLTILMKIMRGDDNERKEGSVVNCFNKHGEAITRHVLALEITFAKGQGKGQGKGRRRPIFLMIF